MISDEPEREGQAVSDDRVMQYLRKTTIQQYKSDVAFRTLVDSVNENMYVIPKYQRKFRWSKEKVIGLVESLLRGLPIPPIYTCRNRDNQLEILDGQQRVMSLFFYYIGYFLKARKNNAVDFSSLELNGTSFRDALMKHVAMEELHIELDGEDGRSVNVDYAALPVEVKRRLDYTTITVIEIKIDSEGKKEEVLRRIFANLNKGGELLSEQEQRNGIYDCRFYDMLRKFNRTNEKWRAFWGREDSKEKDMEMLLRFCALKKYVTIQRMEKEEHYDIEDYHGSYIRMLDRFSGEAMQFDEAAIMEYKSSLESFVKLIDVRRTVASVALLESFYVIYEKKGWSAHITKDVCDLVLASEKYKNSTRQGTITMKKMDERWNAVYEILSRYNPIDCGQNCV